MIKRTTPNYRKITENLQDNSFTGSGGIDISKAPTSRETVKDMTNFEVAEDGGLRLRKPLILKKDLIKEISEKYNISPLLIRAKRLYDNTTYLVHIFTMNVNTLSNYNYLFCVDSSKDTNDLKPINFYNNSTNELEYEVPLSGSINGINFSNFDIINTFSSSIVTGVSFDTSKYPEYYDQDTLDDEEIYRYLRVEISEYECKMYVIQPEINVLNDQNSPILNPNMSLDYAYAVRDNYNAQVLSCEGILGYTLCSKNEDDTFEPVKSSINNLTVKLLTESNKELSYKVISTVTSTFINEICLKAFLNIKPVTKNKVLCIWEKTYDGVNWEEIDNFTQNINSSKIITINIKDSIVENLEGSIQTYTPKKYRILEATNENDLVTSRADILKINGFDSATYRFTMRSYVERNYSKDYKLNSLIVDDQVIDSPVEGGQYLIEKSINLNGTFLRKVNISYKFENRNAYINNTFSARLFQRNYSTPDTPNEQEFLIAANVKIAENNLLNFNVEIPSSTIKLNGFYKFIPTKIVIYKDGFIFSYINIVLYVHSNQITEATVFPNINDLISINNIKLGENTKMHWENNYFNPDERRDYLYNTEAYIKLNEGNTKKNSLEENKAYYTDWHLGFSKEISYIDFDANACALSLGFGSDEYLTYVQDLRLDIRALNFRVNTYNKNTEVGYVNLLAFKLNLTEEEFEEMVESGRITLSSPVKINNFGRFATLYFKFDDGVVREVTSYGANYFNEIDFSYDKTFGDNKLNLDSAYAFPEDNNCMFPNIGENPPAEDDDLLVEDDTFLLDQKEYMLTLGDKTEVLYNEYGSSVNGEKLYYKKSIYTYGLSQFKNNIFPSDTDSFVTPLFNVIDLEVSDNSTINVLIPWRDYLIAASDNAIYLISKVDNYYTTKTINTYIGIPYNDRKTCKSILNGLIFKSGTKLYTLQPNPYSSDETILNIKDISTPIEKYLSETRPNDKDFAFTTEKAYYLFLGIAAEDNTIKHSLCLMYEYSRGIWQKFNYPINIIDYYINSVDDIILIDDKGREYYFNKELYEVPNNLTDDVLNSLPYADYVDYKLNELNNFGTTSENTKYKPIEFYLDSGEKTFNIVDTKQFVESKIILTTQSEQDTLNIDLDINVDGSPYPIHIDASTDAPLWKSSIWEKGSLSTLFVANATKNLNILKQGIFRYSGKGKSISHILKGKSIYNFKLYVIHYRFKNLNKK